HSMWRRVKLIPFTQTFPVDGTLVDVLKSEAAGILNWAIRGCLAWQKEGLCEPACVGAATAAYRQESDLPAEFLGGFCVVLPGVSVAGKTLFERYQAWCDQRHLSPDDRLSQKAFGLRIKEQFTDIGTRTVRYSGIGLRDAEDER